MLSPRRSFKQVNCSDEVWGNFGKLWRDRARKIMEDTLNFTAQCIGMADDCEVYCKMEMYAMVVR